MSALHPVGGNDQRRRCVSSDDALHDVALDRRLIAKHEQSGVGLARQSAQAHLDRSEHPRLRVSGVKDAAHGRMRQLCFEAFALVSCHDDEVLHAIARGDFAHHCLDHGRGAERQQHLIAPHAV